MKETTQFTGAATPAAEVRNQHEQVRRLFDRHVMPTYGRFDLVLDRGQGSRVWDASGKSYLDLGGGIAVCSLGHCHPAITEALTRQSQRLIHVSNLYYHEPQGRLAERLCGYAGPGKVFFSNSGAEANEGMYKLARKFGHENPGSEGPRFEVLTTANSFHGRTLGGIAATGQEKVKVGFGPLMPGFRCDLPFNDLAAMEAAITPRTAAILIEGIQGEGGITPASPEYLLGLRALCDKHQLLLMMDAVQCGHFRSGAFQSYQRVLEEVPGGQAFRPDAISMAKSLGGGFPIGAFWVTSAHADLLGPGTHATTYGGTPLGCAVALAVMDVIEKEDLTANVRTQGQLIKDGISALSQRYPHIVKGARGLGFMLGLELQAKEGIPAFAGSDKAASVQFVDRLHAAGALTVPSGLQVVRLLPALNLTRSEAAEGLSLIESVIQQIA